MITHFLCALSSRLPTDGDSFSARKLRLRNYSWKKKTSPDFKMVLVPPGHRRNLPGAKWRLSLYLSGMEISTTCVKHWDGIFAITQDGEPRSLTVSRFQYGFPNPRHPRLISGTKINWSGSSESGSCRATQLSAPRPAPVSTPRPRRRGEQSQDGGRAGVRVRSVCEARRQRLPDSAPGLQPRLQVLSPRHCSVCVPGRG